MQVNDAWRKLGCHIRRFHLLLLAGLLSATLAGGCAVLRGPVIPDLETAQDQFLFALERRTILQRKPIKQENVKKEYMAVVAAYERVIKNFPDDTRHTPMARLAIGTLLLKIDEPKPALAEFETVASKFPDDAELQSVALTGKAEALIMLKRIEEAKLALLQCIETYENDPSDSIKSNVTRCRRHLARIQYM